MTVDLSQPLRWSVADPDALALLQDLQANILKGHGRAHTVHVFLRFDPAQAESTKTFLHKLPVTDALAQLRDSASFRSGRAGGALVTLCFLTASGYAALGVPHKAPVGQAFRAGMPARQARLNDPPSAHWEAHFRGVIDAMVLFADDSVAAVRTARRQLLRQLPAGAVVVGQEAGAVLRSRVDPRAGIEHFGFVDGRSQPLVLEEDIARERDERDGIAVWSPRLGLDAVLVKDPGASAGTSFGSFLVFRKLEQDVRGFRRAEAALARFLHLTGPDRERAGALVVGRFRDGTPLVAQGRAGARHPVPNNFTYHDDATGAKCPLHAHIRKTNPRGESASDGGVTEQQERSHLLVRRGIPYGRRRKHPHDPTLVLADCPSHGVGLLFMAYQSSIERQFEFVQSRWANAPGFVSPDHVAGGPVTGIDPLIGQGPDGGPAPAAGQGCPVAWGGAAATLRKPFDFQGFVRMRGGAYFFAPALSTLKTL